MRRSAQVIYYHAEPLVSTLFFAAGKILAELWATLGNRREMRNMSQTTELLNFVYQNAQMGTVTIRQLLDIVDEDDFKRHLEAQEKGYQDMEQ